MSFSMPFSQRFRNTGGGGVAWFTGVWVNVDGLSWTSSPDVGVGRGQKSFSVRALAAPI